MKIPRRAVALFVLGVFSLTPALASAQSAKEWVDRGLEYGKKREWEKAIKCYTKAISIKTNYALAYNNRGWVYYLIKKYDKALEDVTKALIYANADDKYVLSLSYDSRSNIYRELGRYSEAMEDINRSISIKPDYWFAYYTRGLNYIAMGKRSRGLEDIKKACDMGVKEACAAYKRYKYKPKPKKPKEEEPTLL